MATRERRADLQTPSRHDVQSYALFPHMSVAANIGYGLKARQLPKSEIERRLRDVLALVRLDGYEERRPRELSGGHSSASHSPARW